MSTAKNYLITGAGRGIGRGLSRLLLQKGNRVFLVDNNQEELNHTAATLARTYEQGKDFSPFFCNLRKPEEITSVVASVKDLCNGHLDVLVNNAANTAAVGATHLSDLTLEEWNASIETNLTAPMLLSQGCLPLLQKSSTRSQAGCIIHMSSTRAIQSEPNNEPYSATKAGLLGLTQSMAVSLAPQGVRVNAILPGWINVTNESKAADESGQTWEDGLSKEDHQWHLTGRVGRVEDILKAIEYLVDNDGVSGSELIVDGGVTRKMVYPEE
ncbi:putative oxidoreductase [Pseudocercospora fuligena]|uniref:Putative oxidoreductase n=1 Tax=Pseudocercospora fuligena TaxID=685502 RepID=A0A8H6VML1_9PEZI|nr:putative oxidoreductase [Pseudocercospora fuligena]